MTTLLRAAQRQINIKVSQAFYEKLEKMAVEADEGVGRFAGFLLDAAFAARTTPPKDAKLDAHVALVGLATMGGGTREQLAIGTGLSIETVTRMQDAWKSVLQNRRCAR